MDTEQLLAEIQLLREENALLKNENEMLCEENEKYRKQYDTYADKRKHYYEQNKEYVKEKAKEGLKKLAAENPAKLKEYRRNAYLKLKAKREQEKMNINK